MLPHNLVSIDIGISEISIKTIHDIVLIFHSEGTLQLQLSLFFSNSTVVSLTSQLMHLRRSHCIAIYLVRCIIKRAQVIDSAFILSHSNDFI